MLRRRSVTVGERALEPPEPARIPEPWPPPDEAERPSPPPPPSPAPEPDRDPEHDLHRAFAEPMLGRALGHALASGRGRRDGRLYRAQATAAAIA
jgi:hypothetical protein